MHAFAFQGTNYIVIYIVICENTFMLIMPANFFQKALAFGGSEWPKIAAK